MRRAVALLIAALCVACTTPRVATPADDQPPPALHLRVGDEIRLVTKHRERYGVRITQLQPTALMGVTLAPRQNDTAAKGTSVVVPYDDLALVQVRRVSAMKTVMATVVVAGAVVVATDLVGLASFPSAPGGT